ncbi:hypothetical protein SPX_26490 [Sporomusa paucivorans]
MADVIQHISTFLLSLVFWFVPIYLFTHFLLKNKRVTMTTKQKIVVAGKGTLFCATAAATVRIILQAIQ